MPRKRGRGGKRKGGFQNKRELDFKDEGEEYGQITKLLGQGRMMVFCFDGKTRLGKIRGKFKRRVWIGLSIFIYIKYLNIRRYCSC